MVAVHGARLSEKLMRVFLWTPSIDSVPDLFTLAIGSKDPFY